MPVYIYRAKKGPEEILEGEIEASAKEDALAKIDSLGLFPIWVKEKTVLSRRTPKVSLKELAEFTNQLAILMKSGSTLLSSLTTLSSETEQASLKPVVTDIIAKVKDGEEFSESLTKSSAVFSPLYVSLVKIGEASGTLGENLERIAGFLEEELDFRTNITSVLTYPLLIIGVGIATIFVLLKFVIPKLVNIFDELGQALPLPTLFLINLSAFVSRCWIFIIAAGFFLFFAGKKYLENKQHKLIWDKFKWRIPLLGEVLMKIEICRFARTLSVLLKNGVPIDYSLSILTSVVPNVFFQEEIKKIDKAVKEGSSLSDSVRRTKIFPPTFINVVAIGEDSGTLGSVLEVLSDDYKKDIDRKIKGLLNLLEPLLILGVGLVVGFVVLSMLLPIFQIDFAF